MATLGDLAKRAGVSKQDAQRVFDALADITAESGSLTVRGFGLFMRAVKKGRTIKSPVLKQEVTYGDSITIRFRPADVLNRKLNQKDTKL